MVRRPQNSVVVVGPRGAVRVLAQRTELTVAKRANERSKNERTKASKSERDPPCSVAVSIRDSGAKGAADLGKVMALLKPKLAGRADMSKVSALVKVKLAG